MFDNKSPDKRRQNQIEIKNLLSNNNRESVFKKSENSLYDYCRRQNNSKYYFFSPKRENNNFDLSRNNSHSKICLSKGTSIENKLILQFLYINIY